MVAGHFGFAAGVKARERQVPLWALMLATVWLDVVVGPLLAAGVETVENAPGTSGGYGNSIIHADWSHSLVGALALAAVFGLVTHRADLAILPGNAGDLPRLGFGLWKAPAASILVELALVVGGAWLYWRAAVEASSGDTRRANLLGGLLLAAGILTLGLDAFLA